MGFSENKLQLSMDKLKPSSETMSLFVKTVHFFVTGIVLYLEALLQWIIPKKAKSLRGEVILITGSAGGLGQELCLQLATSGAKLVLWDVSSKGNEETAKALKNLGAKHVYYDTVDVTDRDQIVAAAEKVRQAVGHVTILVNNAGIAPCFEFLDLSPTAIRKTFDVNVISQFWTIQEFLPHMIATNHGQIVTVASTMSHMAMRGSAPYFASKHSVHGMIECLKHELASKGVDNVKFTTAYPFFFKTNLMDGSDVKLKFRFPSITPFMEVGYVAEKIVEGILYEKEMIYLPSWFRLYLIFIAFVPTKVYHTVIEFLTEEYVIPPLAQKPVERRTSPKVTEPVTSSQDADNHIPLEKRHSFLSPIEKIPLNSGKTE